MPRKMTETPQYGEPPQVQQYPRDPNMFAGRSGKFDVWLTTSANVLYRPEVVNLSAIMVVYRPRGDHRSMTESYGGWISLEGQEEVRRGVLNDAGTTREDRQACLEVALAKLDEFLAFWEAHSAAKAAG